MELRKTNGTKTSEHKAKISSSMKRRWEEMSIKKKKEHKKKVSEGMKKSWNSDNRKTKLGVRNVYHLQLNEKELIEQARKELIRKHILLPNFKIGSD